jgi:hypothetical protein
MFINERREGGYSWKCSDKRGMSLIIGALSEVNQFDSRLTQELRISNIYEVMLKGYELSMFRILK